MTAPDEPHALFVGAGEVTALIDCPPCRGTGVLNQIDLGDLLDAVRLEIPEEFRPWETVRCPICDGAGAFLHRYAA